ncbi:MAG: hypothetical protein ACI857_000206 [Arenicella sp.]|jgi:hypothetical protein
MEIFGISATELIGYLASLALLASFLMKKIRLLRIINSLGCGLFVIYGVLLDYSWPIIITNISIIGINFYYLFIAKKTSE